MIWSGSVRRAFFWPCILCSGSRRCGIRLWPAPRCWFPYTRFFSLCWATGGSGSGSPGPRSWASSWPRWGHAHRLGDAQIGSEAFPAASWGNALAVSSALCFTGYLLLGRLLRQRLSWLPYVGMLYGATALVVGLWFLLSGPGWEARTWRFYGLCLLMALGPQIIGHGTLNYVVRFISPAVVALLVLGEPLLASWGAYMLWGEVPSPISALGMGLTLSGLLLAWWRTGGR